MSAQALRKPTAAGATREELAEMERQTTEALRSLGETMRSLDEVIRAVEAQGVDVQEVLNGPCPS